MHVVHFSDSPFFGGPERQMLGLASALPASIVSSFLCFADGDCCRPFVERATQAGFEASMLRHTNPSWPRMIAEVVGELRRRRADLLSCHGYKADLLGWIAARYVGIPVMTVSRGWTAHTPQVRLYESLDRRILRRMRAVVCVSEGQAEKVRRAGIAADRVVVIRNAIDVERFASPDGRYRERLRSLVRGECREIVCAAGRLSPEKGIDQLVEAAALVVSARPGTGFVVFGEGPMREQLTARIAALGLEGRFVLAPFRDDLDAYLPHADVLALPSYTEGLPNVALEACAAGIPVVATAVGGTPEVVRHGENGYLVPAGDPAALARRLLDLLADPARRAEMGATGRRIVEMEFTFASQSEQYQRLWGTLRPATPPGRLRPESLPHPG